jgi:exodeoxyribonuclease VII large subunit
MSSPVREPQLPQRDVYTVGRLNREVRLLLEQGIGAVWIEAELSNFSRPSSGHWYFTLKDRDAQVRCAMFRQRNLSVRFTPKEGQLLLARARVGLYEPRGDYQLLVEHLEEAGVGALRREFERLRDRLAAEGLFDASHKRPLPTVPRRIGVVTSPTGAALRDILNILRRRFVAAAVLIYPTAVQGAQAAPEILAAVERASQRAEVDVLIVARGGGSLEDLWAFNDERVARAIHDCSMPVVTGIGHEVDFTIADFVADLRAPTPTGAAELVVPDGAAWRSTLSRLGQRFALAMARQLRAEQQSLERLQQRFRLAHPGVRLAQSAQRLDELEQRLVLTLRAQLAGERESLTELRARLAAASPMLRVAAVGARLTHSRSRLAHAGSMLLQQATYRLGLAQRALHGVSPLATLGRGYAIVTAVDSGRLLRDAADVIDGALIDARLGRGLLRARVQQHLPNAFESDHDVD